LLLLAHSNGCYRQATNNSRIFSHDIIYLNTAYSKNTVHRRRSCL